MHTRQLLTLLSFAALATTVHAGRLIAIDNTREIYDINPVTGAKTLISTASAGAGTPGALARNPSSGAIYLASISFDALLNLDIATGSANLIGGFGTTTVVMHGLEWDSTQNALWGASSGNLFRIGENNGVATQVGASGLTSFTNLGYVAATDTLYATNIVTDRLYSVNRQSGTFTSIGLLGAGASNASALAYDSDHSIMYMLDNVADNLYTVNLTTGAATLVGSTGTGNLQGLVYLPGDTPFTPFCFGDGSGTACPCGNAGAPGNGCASSVNVSGANLMAAGNASVSNDTVNLQGSGMPNSSALYFQGTAQQTSVFGDGLRCATGTIIRLGTKQNSAGLSQYPVAPDFTVSVRGQCTPGATRTYQVWYRNAAAFCTVSTFNLSNGLAMTWVP